MIVAALGVRFVQGGTDAVTTVFETPAPRPSDYPPIESDVSDTPLGTPPPVPLVPGPYEFALAQDDTDQPVTWDPCRTVRYVVNPAGAPPGADVLLDEAVARTSAATGLVFVNEGTTDETWAEDRDPYQPDR